MPFPAQAEDLYETLASFTEVYENEEQKNNPGKPVSNQRMVCVPLFFLHKLYLLLVRDNVDVHCGILNLSAGF